MDELRLSTRHDSAAANLAQAMVKVMQVSIPNIAYSLMDVRFYS
jgi:hypothetical protein